MNSMKHNVFRFLGATAALSACGGCSNPSTSQAPKAGDKPNILLVIAEDMTLDLGCYGRTDVRTPNIDRLASEGVMYTNARCVAPLSSPTRSAMMTGLHHTITGSHNHRSHREDPLPDTTVVPFTNYLRSAGYTCILGNDRCFENPVTHADHESTRKIDCNFKFENVGTYDGVEHFGLFDKLYDIEPEDTPFFAQVTLYVTHRGDWWKDIRSQSAHPVNPDDVVLPPYMADHPRIREEFACYLDQVEHMDAEVGILMDYLEEKGVMDNTVVFFIADNGRADIRAKGYMYEDGTHVPMIVWGKGISRDVVDDLVSELDLPATFLHLAGVPQPDYYQGSPLKLFCPGSPAHDRLYLARDNWDENTECLRCIETDRFTYIRNYRADLPYDTHHLYQEFYRPALHVMRTLRDEGLLNETQMLYFAPSKPYEELYDYTSDPFCIHNLSADPAYADTLRALSAMMDDYLAKNPDKGIEDRFDRVLPSDRAEEARPRYFVKKYHPEEWRKLEQGEICDKYDYWKMEMKEMKKNQQLL